MIPFLNYKKIYLIISTVVIVSGLLALGTWGLKPSIEFTGGTNLAYRIALPDQDKIKTTIEKVFKSKEAEIIEYKVSGSEVSIRAKAIDETKIAEIQKEIGKELNIEIPLLRSETIGPTLGAEMLRKTIFACLLATLGILGYITYAFKRFTFALAAIIALVHDILVVFGVYAIISHFFGAELDLLFVTAVLTTMSFSVHDTIVIFDKIREYRAAGTPRLEESANKSLTETLVRSFNNSMTVFFMLLALSLIAGGSIKFFAIALLVGTITGTYSSPFVAVPALTWLEKVWKRKK